MNDPRYQQLFHYAEHITPYLHGELKAEIDIQQDNWIEASAENAELLQDIYSKLQFSHPEAGNAYWLNRTWSLLLWQPIYISFISIYGIHALPQVSKMAQQWRAEVNFVSGFKLPESKMFEGDVESLVHHAAAELLPLFEHYRQQLDQNVRIRPGYTQHLLADLLLMALLRLQDIYTDLPQDYIWQHAQTWLKAFGLSCKPLESLNYDEIDQKWHFVRTTCCMVYRCEGRGMCPDCPRAKKLK
ncbi:MAG: siderophore ferric iron reductase [Vibrio sp.]